MNDTHQIIEGFEVMETGGGCTAQSREFSNGCEILITQSDTADYRATDADYCVGVYAHSRADVADRYWSSDDGRSLAHALSLAIAHVRSIA